MLQKKVGWLVHRIFRQISKLGMSFTYFDFNNFNSFNTIQLRQLQQQQRKMSSPPSYLCSDWINNLKSHRNLRIFWLETETSLSCSMAWGSSRAKLSKVRMNLGTKSNKLQYYRQELFPSKLKYDFEEKIIIKVQVANTKTAKTLQTKHMSSLL